MATVQEQQARQGAEPVELSTFVRIHLREIHSDLRGIKFYYNKKVRPNAWNRSNPVEHSNISTIHSYIHQMADGRDQGA